jgi:hypothetical protein
MSNAAQTINALDTILIAAMDNQDCIGARHAFRLAQRVARETAATTNDPSLMASLRSIEAVATMGLRLDA